MRGLEALGLMEGLRGLTAPPPQTEMIPLQLLLQLAQTLPATAAGSTLAKEPVAEKGWGYNPKPRRTKGVSKIKVMENALRDAGFTVLNEYERPVPWATGGHLHTQWAEPGMRDKQLAMIRGIAEANGINIGIGGLGTGPPHRGRAHKEQRAADIVIRG